MPVLGHAFVGLATASYFQPKDRRLLGAALWFPLLVGLAYLPDIVGQVGLLAGSISCRLLAHSLWFALFISPFLAVPLARATGLSSMSALVIVLLSIVMHDGLDLLQGSDPEPFWPASEWRIPNGWRVLPRAMGREVPLFAVPCLTVSILCFLQRRRRNRWSKRSDAMAPSRYRSVQVAAIGLTACLFLLAGGTHYLRARRVAQLQQAVELIRAGNPSAAFPLIDDSMRWPSAGVEGRAEFARGQAYMAMGDRARAETCFQTGVAKAPDDFWLLIFLADFYALSDEPLEARIRHTQPVLAELLDRFPREQSVIFHVAQLRNRLGLPASRPN